MTKLLLRGVKPFLLDTQTFSDSPLDILVDETGHLLDMKENLTEPGAEVLDLDGTYISPGWVDLHTHIYYGATDISVRPTQAGRQTGVTTIIDAGSAGEANFHGFREYIAQRAEERIYAFLNVGSIGLVATNRVSELIDIRSIDIDRTLACVHANRDLIKGLKVRASHVILGSWGITPVRLAKKLARISKLPLMVHVGEPPPLLEEILELLEPGDIVTHCFHGKSGGNILEDEDLFILANQLAEKGIIFDIGHGSASYSFRVAEASIKQGLYPSTISTDLHQRNVNGPVWDLPTVMSKMLAVGMPLMEVVRAVTITPRQALGLPFTDAYKEGSFVDFTIFRAVDHELTLEDSKGEPFTLQKLIAPRYTLMGRNLKPASSQFTKGDTHA